MKFSKTILLVMVFFTLVSCSTFQKNLENPTKLTKENVAQLDGMYTVVPTEKDTINTNGPSAIFRYGNLISELDRKLLKDTLRFDSTKKYTAQLKVQSPKLLQIKYFEDGKVYRTRNIKTRITNDGYLLLKNKNIGFVLVPFICGAIDINRTRITVDKEGDLLFDVANTRAGAALLIVFADGRTQKYRNSYGRISNN